MALLRDDQGFPIRKSLELDKKARDEIALSVRTPAVTGLSQSSLTVKPEELGPKSERSTVNKNPFADDDDNDESQPPIVQPSMIDIVTCSRPYNRIREIQNERTSSEDIKPPMKISAEVELYRHIIVDTEIEISPPILRNKRKEISSRLGVIMQRTDQELREDGYGHNIKCIDAADDHTLVKFLTRNYGINASI